jgi:hypothetical protein
MTTTLTSPTKATKTLTPFQQFSALVNKKLNSFGTNELYTVQVPELFDKYLAAFPEGTNPIFRERTEHDCNCCKQFIRNLGNVVAIVNNQLVSVWDVEGAPYPYDVVAEAMSTLVKNSPIVSVYRTKETSFGVEKNRDNYDANIIWHHFYGKVPRQCQHRQPDTEKGRINTFAQVLKRGLTEINSIDLDTVLYLIKQNSLYRGAEFKDSVLKFKKIQQEYTKSGNSDLIVWSNANSSVAGFRNTVIGTLLVDLANGDDLETAVRKFEAKVAPTNYKRPTALITPKMIEQAVAKLKELDLEDSIHRRFARIEDVSVNDVLFVDNSVASKMKDGIADLLMDSVAPVKTNKATPISIDAFMSMNHKNISLVLSGSNLSNFVSLTAPVHSEVNPIFKWNNNFAWSYDGEVTDSIKERVGKAGGNITTATMRCSLAWFNYDDLDIHCHDPNGNHIYYGQRQGILDVDMNISPQTREPVENLSWKTITDGTYKISVNSYTPRETVDVGFVLQVEFNNQIFEYAYKKRVTGTVHVLDLVVQGGKLVKVNTHNGIEGGGELTVEKWGVTTGVPSKVNTIMLSPNHWENAGGVGNKHWFFILDKCINPNPVRGIYNEFLLGSLEPHRKVFEVLGSKTKCQPTDEQLSGVGFSSTRGDKVTAIADGRTFEIQF